MQRKLHVFCFALVMLFSFTRSQAQCKKSEVALGYGYYSFYSFVNHGMNTAPYSTSSGSFTLGYRYYLSNQVTLGLGLGYENITSWGSFFSIVPEVTVAYLDTKHDHIRVRLYGSVSGGISSFTQNVLARGEVDQSGIKLWAFQATPFGMRIGRQFAGFVELGLGYKGLVHAGMELRFPRLIRVREVID